jgi:predicted amidohydrolase
MSGELKIALCQMTSVDDVSANSLQIKKLINDSEAGIRLFCFPENCLYMRVREGESIPAFSLQDPVFGDLATLAKERNAFIHLGSVPLQLGPSVFNSSILISDQGTLETSYQKIHLFDIQLTGQKAIRESDVFTHGSGPGVFSVDGWKIAQTICYDLRFAELYSQYARENVDVILVPSAFLVKTGEAHWEVLLRARAIESQCYVVASAQAGTHHSVRGNGSRETFGNSMVVEPWGAMAIRLDGSTMQTSVCVLHKSKIDQARAQIPMTHHRRLSLK